MNFIIFEYRHLCLLYIHNQLAHHNLYILIWHKKKSENILVKLYVQVSDFKFNLKRYMVPLCLTKMHSKQKTIYLNT